MKKILLTLVAGFLTCSVFGQGGVLFATRGGTLNVTVTDSLTGQPAGGSAYMAQLYYSAPGAGESAMRPVLAAPGGATGGVVTFGTGAIAGQILSGVGGAGNRFTDPAVVAYGSLGDFQIRAWQASLGSTWETALGAWTATTVLGKSGIVPVTTQASATAPIPTLAGLQNWSLVPNVIPEPSVIALGAIGLVALLWRRRS